MESFRKWVQNIWPNRSGNDSDHPSDSSEYRQSPKPKKNSKAKKKNGSISSDTKAFLKPSWKDYLLLDKRIRFVYVVVLCVILGLILPSVISYYLGEYQADLGNCNPPTLNKFECLSGSTEPVTPESCEAAGCCYDVNSSPKCFHKNPTRYTYLVSDFEELPHKITVNLTSERRTVDYYGTPLPKAKAIVKAVNPHHLIVLFLSEWQSEDSAYQLKTEDQMTPFDETDFEVSVSLVKKRSFGIIIRRSGTGTVLLDTTRGPLVIDDEYVEMTTSVPSENVYGLGLERKGSFTRNFNYAKTALYNRAAGGADGFHPFYMAVEPTDGLFHGVFWDNRYPLELQFSPTPAISFRAMGGSGVFHIFSGPTPADVSRQYARDIIGPAVMPPFWSLGFHLCRENDDPSVFTKTLDQMVGSGIGFDSDCIDRRLSGPGAGEIDTDRFPEVESQRQKLINLYKKFILVKPPHVAQQDLFQNLQWIQMDSNSDGTQLVEGSRFGSIVKYPSFEGIDQPDIGEEWGPVYNPDGFDLVDNWPSNDRQLNCSDRFRPFIPERIGNGKITENTLCLDSWHPSLRQEHFAVHNHYGIQHLNSVFQPGWPVRWLYLNRASALGNLGKAGYSGEEAVSANWLTMKQSLVQTLEMGLFNVPLSGAPICGSIDSTFVDNLPTLDDEQLCIRWYQMGLLLPYAHSTNKLGHRARSPVDWSLSASRFISTYIQQRYQLLAQYYTLIYEAATEGTPVVRPMFYNFPNDPQTYNISEQFMIGDDIMVCPVFIQELEENTVSVNAYFPSGTWYDYYSGDWLLDSYGKTTAIATGLYHINMFVRNASVVITQEPGFSAEDTRKNPYTVTTAFPILTEAEGRLFVDDGMTSNSEAFDLVQFQFTNTTFTMELIHDGFPGSDVVSTVIDRIRILGITLSDGEVPPNAEYNHQTQVLTFNNLNLNWKDAKSYSINFSR